MIQPETHAHPARVVQVDGDVDAVDEHVVVRRHVHHDQGEPRRHLPGDGDAEGGHYLAARPLHLLRLRVDQHPLGHHLEGRGDRWRGGEVSFGSGLRLKRQVKTGKLLEWVRLERQVAGGEVKRGELRKWNKVV